MNYHVPLSSKIIMMSALTVAVTLTSACSSSPRTYEPERSEAYNVALAGGMRSGLKDTPVPQAEIDNINGEVFDAAFVASGFIDPVLSLSNLQSGTMNLLTILSSPDKHGGRNTLLAWVPTSLASNESEALVVIREAVAEASVSALTSLESGYELALNAGKNVGIIIENESWGCPPFAEANNDLNEVCQIRSYIREPDIASAAGFITGGGIEQRYVLDAGVNYFVPKLEILLPDDHTVPVSELYSTISKELPEWVYIHLPAGSIISADGRTIPFPYMLNQGKPLYYIVPQ